MAMTRPRYSSIYDTDYKQSVRAATTADVGNLAATGNMTNTIDGVTLVINDRVLVKNQGNSAQNGIYYVSVLGTGSNGTWLRAPDAADGTKLTFGAQTVVAEGTANSGALYILTTADPITVNSTNLTWATKVATPAGSTTQVQYNKSGVLTASAALTFNDTSNVLALTGNITSPSHFSGNSNIAYYPSSNITVSVAGTSNVATFTTTGITVPGNVSFANTAGGAGARIVFNNTQNTIDFFFG